jgi:hypothetical protein
VGHDVITAPVVSNGKADVSTYDGSVTCIDAISGTIVWTKRMNATSAPWIAGDYVHVAQRNAPPSASSSRRANDGEQHSSLPEARENRHSSKFVISSVTGPARPFSRIG